MRRNCCISGDTGTAVTFPERCGGTVITVTEPRAAGRGPSSVWVGVLGGLAVLALLATLPLSLLSGQVGEGIVAVVIGIPCAAVGVVVARRQPGNPLGWLFLISAVGLFVSNDGGDYAYFVYRLGHPVPFGPVALALDQLWTPALVLFVAVILLFPDGRLPSGFARWGIRVLWAAYAVLLAAIAVATAGALAARPVRIDASGGLSATDNPGGASS